MSSNYLSFANMNMIERLLAEVRQSAQPHDAGTETAALNFLVREVEQSQAAEADLRQKLAVHLGEWETADAAIARWDDDGFSGGKSRRAEAQRLSDQLPDQVRAAIATFLNACQKEARPFAISQALGAVRSVFPDLDISDQDLVDAITSEASVAGFDVNYGLPRPSKASG